MTVVKRGLMKLIPKAENQLARVKQFGIPGDTETLCNYIVSRIDLDAQFLKFLELDIDVNAKQHYAGNATALHLACLDRNSEIVQTMIDMADATKLDFAALCFRSTALEFVTVRGFQEIIDIFNSRNIRE